MKSIFWKKVLLPLTLHYTLDKGGDAVEELHKIRRKTKETSLKSKIYER